MPGTKSQRPKVTGVTIDVEYPDGKSKKIKIDPTRVEALFWSDHTVLDIFAPFYETKDVYITKDEMIARFGEKGKNMITTGDKVKVTKELIKELWETQDPDGFLPVTLGKTNDCLPR